MSDELLNELAGASERKVVRRLSLKARCRPMRII